MTASSELFALVGVLINFAPLFYFWEIIEQKPISKKEIRQRVQSIYKMSSLDLSFSNLNDCMNTFVQINLTREMPLKFSRARFICT